MTVGSVSQDAQTHGEVTMAHTWAHTSTAYYKQILGTFTRGRPIGPSSMYSINSQPPINSSNQFVDSFPQMRGEGEEDSEQAQGHYWDGVYIHMYVWEERGGDKRVKRVRYIQIFFFF